MVELTCIGNENAADYIGFFPPEIAEKSTRKNGAVLLGIEVDDTAVGGMAFTFGEDVSRLLWLEIAPSRRCRGLGGEAFFSLMLYLRSCGVKKLKAVISPDDDDAFKRLLRSYPVEYVKREEGLVRCTVEDFHVFPRVMQPSKHSVALSAVPIEKLNALCTKAVKNGLDLVPMPISVNEYDKQLSSVLMIKDQPAGLLLIQEYEPGCYCVPLFFGFTKSGTKLMDMACRTRAEADRLLSPDTIVEVAYVNPSLETMLMKRADRVDVNMLVKAQDAVIPLRAVL